MTLKSPQQSELLSTRQCLEQTRGNFPEHCGALLCSCQLLRCQNHSHGSSSAEHALSCGLATIFGPCNGAQGMLDVQHRLGLGARRSCTSWLPGRNMYGSDAPLPLPCSSCVMESLQQGHGMVGVGQ